MDLFVYALRTLSGAIVTPPLVFLLMTLIVMLHLKNKKVVTMQKIILGGSVNSSIELTLSQFVFGIIGGIVGSLILTSLGIIFSESSGISYLFLISILLMFIKPRLICFSYSGAVLGLISIIFKFINNYSPDISSIVTLDLNIFYLAILIGVLHIIEGLLVIVDGDRGAIPIFTNKDGKILGGYALKRYWALPIAIITVLNMNNSNYITEFISSPDWWPLIKPSYEFVLIAGSIISIAPFYMILGYSSVTFTRSKREKAFSSGVHILIYGIILAIVAQVATFRILGEIFIIIFMPLAHELMFKLQVNDEKKRIPKFVSDEEGLMILEILSDSPIKKLGIEIESKLLSINNKKISSEVEAYSILKENLYSAILKIKDTKGNIKDIQFRYNKNTRLGVLLVPRKIDSKDIASIDEINFKDVLKSFKSSDDKNNKM